MVALFALLIERFHWTVPTPFGIARKVREHSYYLSSVTWLESSSAWADSQMPAVTKAAFALLCGTMAEDGSLPPTHTRTHTHMPHSLLSGRAAARRAALVVAIRRRRGVGSR